MVSPSALCGYWDVIRAAKRLTTQHEEDIRRALHPPSRLSSSSGPLMSAPGVGVASVPASSSSAVVATPSVSSSAAAAGPQGVGGLGGAEPGHGHHHHHHHHEWCCSVVEEEIRRERARDVRALITSLSALLEGLEDPDGEAPRPAPPTSSSHGRSRINAPPQPPQQQAPRAGVVRAVPAGSCASAAAAAALPSSSSDGGADKCWSGGASPSIPASASNTQETGGVEARNAAAGGGGGEDESTTSTSTGETSASGKAGGKSGAHGDATAAVPVEPACAVVVEEEEEAAVSRVEMVLSNEPLVHVILAFLVHGENPNTARRQLSALAGVNAMWREMCKSDVYWRPIARELFPLQAMAQRNNHNSHHKDEDEEANTNSTLAWQQVMRYGRSVVQRRITIAEWHEGITLSFEIFDEADGLRLFAAQGPIRVLGTTKPGSLALKLIQPKAFHSAAFSAASRDPDMRFGSVTDYFTDGHDAMYPASLSVRVMATDERSGRMALVYSSSKSTKHWIEPMPNNNAAMPEGSLLVNQHWTRVATSVTGQAMQMLTVFFVGPVEGQDEDLPEAHRLYRVLETQTLYITLQFKEESAEMIGKFIRGLLAEDQGAAGGPPLGHQAMAANHHV